MNKEKLERLNIYKTKLENQLSSKVPSKHQSNPDTYKRYLENELRLVKLTIERAKEC